MPSVNESQRRMMCLALAIKLGKAPASKSPQAAKMAKEMTMQQLSDFCKAPVKE